GGLPKGLSLSTDGTIAGVPDAAPGQFPFTVQVLDAFGATGRTAFTLMLATPVIRIASTALPGARVGQAYRHSLRASGGSPGYMWRLATGSLPAGLRLTSGGVIFGSPRARGVRLFTLQAIDAHGISGSQSFRLVVHRAKRTPATRG
ncbi:MAG: large repetitive protein, partial [Actinomycetota bacterium]|nr:large repetitive protein [Actinomycetota bacterium]